MLGTIRMYREVAGRVPDFHVDVLLVQDGLMLVDLGDFGSVVENEPPRHVPHNQSWKKSSPVSLGGKLLESG